jgi:CRP-like cAMP-binding protein
MAGTRKVEAGKYLFKEGDPPDAMYVVKSGKLAITKAKANSEITLAEIGPGAMVGEMAFFDNKARSASVKAIKDTEVIALPYKALHAQFSQFPEWAKAIMRTVNDHLRTANQRIKSLESGNAETEEFLPPHTINKLIAIFCMVCMKFGKKSEKGPQAVEITGSVLRDYTIQVFQEAPGKMQKLLAALAEMNMTVVEDLGEGQQRLTSLEPDLLFAFLDWHNRFLFKREEERILVQPVDLKCLKAVLHFCKTEPRDSKGLALLNVTKLLSEAPTAMGYAVKAEELDGVIAKGLMSEKSIEKDVIIARVQMDDLEKIIPFWEIIFKLRTVQR